MVMKPVISGGQALGLIYLEDKVKSKEEKKQEAMDRTKAYNSLSPAKKLELIRSRRGKSKKESNKILNQMENKDEIIK